jgi:DNA repair exonuclease SbcCD ATPase subunit
MSKTNQSTSHKRLSNANRLSARAEVTPPTEVRRKLERLIWRLEEDRKRLQQVARQRDELAAYLAVADQVTDALDVLSQKLFEEVLGALETHLTIAIQEVLEQPIKFRAQASFKRGTANVDFSIDRDGNEEDVQRGQGGSVQNVLSVGLRMFALATLDENEHRRFLVLDEQDCWLRPELVPRLVNIIYRAARELDFQVILISHHDLELFEEYADKIYRFEPTNEGLKVDEVRRQALNPDLDGNPN